MRYHDAAQSLWVWSVSQSLYGESDATSSVRTTRPIATTSARPKARLQDNILRYCVELLGTRQSPRSRVIFWERSFTVAEIRLTFLGNGAVNCIHRAHTAIVLDCADGTRVLLDTSSGNRCCGTACRWGCWPPICVGAAHPPPCRSYRRFAVRAVPARADRPAGPPLQSTAPKRPSCHQASVPGHASSLRMDQDQAQNQEGQVVMQWHPIAEGERVQLGPTTSGCPFPG